MKNGFVMLILLCLLCFVVCRCIFAENIANKDSIDIYTPLATEPMKHKVHTHEHSGLACCPCGVCHKHDDEDHQHSYVEFRRWMRLVGAILCCAVVLSIMH